MRPLATVPGLAVLALAVLPPVALAGADSGFYIGGGVGQSMVESSDTDTVNGPVDFDGDDIGYKVFGGFNFGVVPLIDLAAEVGYIDFGKPDDTVAGVNASVDLDGFTAMGLAGLSFGPFGVFAKAGVISWDGEARIGGLSASDDGTDPAYGLGARFQIGSLALRGEIEYFDIDDIDDVYFASVSALWTF